MSRIRGRDVVTVGVLALLFLFPGVARAAAGPSGTSIDLRMGYYSDAEAAMLGGGVLAGIAPSWMFNPNLEYVAIDHGNEFTLNADFHYDLRVGSPWSFWVGAGPSFIHAHPDFGDNENRLGANLVAGIGSRRGRFLPFAQGKLVLSNNSEAVIALGVRF